METDETIKKGFLRLERYAQNIPGGFHCCAEDPENGYPFAYVSDRFLEILGWEREEFAARFDNRYTALIHPDDLAAGLRYRNAENSATYAKNGDSIFRLLGKNGYRWVTNAANQVEWYGKGYIVGTITDITPYMELREKLEQQNRTQREALETANHNLLRMMQQMEEQKAQFAQTTARSMEKEKRYRQRLNHDALTGTYNRRYYEEVVRNNIGPAGIALMDIDDFKICNDTYGHHAGDLALETVAKAIRSCIRETDLLIRYGGDEFLLVLPGIPADYFKVKLEQIRTAVQQTVVPGLPPLPAVAEHRRRAADPCRPYGKRGAPGRFYNVSGQKPQGRRGGGHTGQPVGCTEGCLRGKARDPAGGRFHDEPHDACRHSGR